VALAAEIGFVIDQKGRGAFVDAVATYAGEILTGVRIEADVIHFGVRLVTLAADRNLRGHISLAGVGDILGRRIVDVNRTAGVAAYTGNSHRGILHFGRQPVSGLCQVLVIPVMTHQAGLIVNRRIVGRHNCGHNSQQKEGAKGEREEPVFNMSEDSCHIAPQKVSDKCHPYVIFFLVIDIDFMYGYATENMFFVVIFFTMMRDKELGWCGLLTIFVVKGYLTHYGLRRSTELRHLARFLVKCC